jgi:hypothetical protein
MLPILIATSVLASSASAFAENSPFNTKSQGVKNIAVFGDSPYGTSPTDTSQLAATPAFIDSIDADPDVSLALHVGDIHSGSQYCTEAYNRAVLICGRISGFRSCIHPGITNGQTAINPKKAAAHTVRTRAKSSTGAIQVEV